MPISAKRRLAVGAVGLAVLAGAGGAYAAGQSSSQTPTPSPATPNKTPAKPADLQAEANAFLDDLAKRLNVPRDQLDAAIKGASEDRIDAAVAAGKLTKEQGDALKQRLANGVPGLLAGPLLGGGPRGPHGPGGGPGFGGGRGFGVGIDAAANYLGLTEQQLRDQLQSGKSLADIAKATQGKSVDGLKAALQAKAKAQLDQAVKDKHLTQAQADKIAAELNSHLDELINNTLPKGAPKLRFRHP